MNPELRAKLDQLSELATDGDFEFWSLANEICDFFESYLVTGLDLKEDLKAIHAAERNREYLERKKHAS